MATLIPLDGTAKVGYTKGGSVILNGKVIFGRYSYEAGHPDCNPDGMCIKIQ